MPAPELFADQVLVLPSLSLSLSSMAHGRHDALPACHDTKKDEKKNSSGQQRRIELEQEVAMLQKMLENEEKVHQVLERAMQPEAIGSSLHIPSFLPKKAKELLAELVMVEEEIARLEAEVSKIQQCLCDTQEGQDQGILRSNKEQEASQHVTEPLDQSLAYYTPSSRDATIQDKLPLESNPLFFINQAIKGDYIIHGFTRKEKIRKLATKNGKKGGQMMMEPHEIIPKKSGIIEKPRKSITKEKQSSPKLPPKHSMPRQPKHNEEISSSLLQEPSYISSSLEKNHKKLQPNKLSEEIMKSLICIFLRLVRTSRAMELEKTSNLSRSANLLLRSGSFKVENSMNLKGLNAHKGKSQQDPYGIFEIEDSLVRDIGPYKNLIRFTSSSMDLKGFSNSLPLLNKLRLLINDLQEVDIKFLSHQQKLAFWINMHNTCIMHGFLEHGLPSSQQKLIALRNKAVLNIGGNKLNALAIEHFILRQPSNIKEASWKGDKDGKEDDVRSIYGLEHPEPNISFALCSGNRSSPAVKIYTADYVSSELEKSKVDYLQASIVVTKSKRLMIPKLLLLNMYDFVEDLSSLVDWICYQLPTSGSLRKSISECMKGQNNEKISDIVDVIPCDFKFQYLFPM